ncbi:MAG: hypothetical protein COV69_03295 [Parcubacteria group bacterium CG11_big_fil_rev_8_21_14_0_20_39_14]|nr:MAG: hypothetical protein COV69_03295 [Parcubacteria group bacterium CG11_big_fil_rev_8_21_14_0_20_39_14]PIS35518.1 MAG: hypothetical protein COT36_02010 [Parcubacteria group bacterium CG08_land_8_20_14_0_20_38_56]
MDKTMKKILLEHNGKLTMGLVSREEELFGAEGLLPAIIIELSNGENLYMSVAEFRELKVRANYQ